MLQNWNRRLQSSDYHKLKVAKTFDTTSFINNSVINLFHTEHLIKISLLKKTILILYCFLLSSLPALQSQNAPVTTTGFFTTAVPGDPSVPLPIAVAGFTEIGQFTLTMKFDTTMVRYVSHIVNPSLPGMTVTYTSPSGNTQGKLVFAWTGASNISLTDGSSLADLTFFYVTGTGILSWAYILGSVCQYKRYVSGVLTVLNDNPRYLFYQNGGISDRTAPVTFSPAFTNPIPGALPVPITVIGFTDIRAITLYMEYDPTIITYQNSFTKNPAFGTSFIVGDVTGTGGKRMIIIQWYDGSTVTLADGSAICTLNFTYPTASCNACALGWFDNGPSCEYVDGSGDVLIDMPQADYYLNGLVAEGLLYTWTGNISSAWNNAGNWNACGIPDITRQVVIPDVSPNSFPTITGTASCKSIKIQTGATVTISPTGSITVGDN
jgi:hypothetical protein